MLCVRLGLMLVFGLSSPTMAASPEVLVTPIVPPVIAVIFQNDAAAPPDAGSPEGESDSSGQEASSAPAAGEDAPVDEELTPGEKEQRKNFLSIAWLLLIGVGVVGLLLLLMVLFIGSSVRRVTRQPAPQAPLRDQLWYLKPDTSKDGSGDGVAEDQTDGEKKHDS